MVGKKISSVNGLEQYSEEVFVNTECGSKYMFHHEQDCCESVTLNDFEVGTNDLSGALIISAEESTNSDDSTGVDDPDSFTWTFYKIETTKGEIWMRWLGESNGYYSESVSFKVIEDEKTPEEDKRSYLEKERDKLSALPDDAFIIFQDGTSLSKQEALSNIESAIEATRLNVN